MAVIKIKQSLLDIANRVKPTTTLEDVYEQLALLHDIETSEEQEKQGKIITHAKVKEQVKKWLF